MDLACAPQDGEEWELRHDDDGFTYKILKRQRLTDPSAAVSQLPFTDPKLEAKQRRERKRNTLLKLKNQYQNEIHKWEVLSNTLRSMEEKTKEVKQAASYLGSSNSSVVKKSEDSSGSLVDELLLQAETQEVIIRDISNLCDVAEAMCDAQQEQLVQSFIDLPVWSSPRELMKSLCDDVERCQNFFHYGCND
ncbi:PREDICTED: uncharacterized protein LOC105109944 [Populus euphratica]|uniref:Uncharacterized protein LOC105109944 n=1 Tax=Populus euphratica TaxID=75702 RepID=A0AAJ6T344_POPEU|nr:PREDICTED: uncharacterized protein LOC105109944 [Populus euphratica]